MLGHRTFFFEVLRAPSPYAYRCGLCRSSDECSGACFDQLAAILRERKGEIAAVIVEPGLQGAGGMITFPPGYLRKLRALTAEVGTLLVFDEVAVGMGRSGKMFACQREGVVPDFLCIAKGLTGGYVPLAATLTTQKVYEAFLGPPEEGRTFFHGHTYTGNAIGCAAALATLDIFQKERLLERLDDKIAHFQRALVGLEAHPNVGQVRQYGLAAGVEIVTDRKSRNPFPSSMRLGMKVCRAARDKGVFLRPLGDIIVLMPPLTIEDEELDQLVDAVAHGLRKVLGAGAEGS